MVAYHFKPIVFNRRAYVKSGKIVERFSETLTAVILSTLRE